MLQKALNQNKGRIPAIFKYRKIISILERIEYYRGNISDMHKRIEIEDAKPYLDSYLITPRNWYIDTIKFYENRIRILYELKKHIEIE